MTAHLEIRVPDIGEFEEVDVIEVLVRPGDPIAEEQSLITLESDKATMEIPSPAAGVLRELVVEVGAKVSQGDLIARIESLEAGATPPEQEATRPSAPKQASSPEPQGEADRHAEVLVLGAGPGGYTAAFRAADLGKRVVLVERYGELGGVCLNVGCIPSKALLHLADVMTEARALRDHGVDFGEPSIDLKKIRDFKNGVVSKLTQGLSALAKRRKVEIVRGIGSFESPNRLRIESEEGSSTVSFDHAVIAAGSQSVTLPGIPHEHPGVLDSSSALRVDSIPERLLVIGGGVIGLEMASVFHALGSRVTVVELLDRLIPGADLDLVEPLRSVVESRYENIFLGTRVTSVEPDGDGLRVHFEGGDAPKSERFDQVLVAVGRRPNGDRIGAELAGVAVDDHGFIAVDAQQRSNVPHIFAIGDLVQGPMLAHKASHQGKVAAEVIAGHKSAFDAAAIPSVAYTDPEVAWVGLTELEAAERGPAIRTARFPWQASGRALGIARPEGHTKLVLDAASGRLLGAGIVGPNAGELIAELVLALEMGADAQDLALTIHPHPTLSETVGLAAEWAEGTITDLYVPKKKR